MINIKSIWENHKPNGEIIIKTRIDEIKHLNCFAATNHITGQHLYIMSVSKNVVIPELNNFRFKGVQIYTLPNKTDNKIDLYIYLLDNDLKDIFSLFIQNILEDIEKNITESESIKTTLNIVTKWKKLFDKMNFHGLSSEQEKGLIGELLFLNYLLKNENTSLNAINSWTATEQDFRAKDFIIGPYGFEIKFTTSSQTQLKISNEKQLDIENLDDLFIVLYSCEAVKDKGITLNSIIEQVRNNISINEIKNIFNYKLHLYGYFDEDKEHYTSKYSIQNIFAYVVKSDFPKIVKEQLPIGLFNISYNIEISSIEKFKIDLDKKIKSI